MCIITAYVVRCLGCWLLEVRCGAAGYAFGIRDVARVLYAYDCLTFDNLTIQTYVNVHKVNYLDIHLKCHVHVKNYNVNIVSIFCFVGYIRVHGIEIVLPNPRPHFTEKY